MKYLCGASLVFLAACTIQSGPVTEYADGQWWTGDGYQSGSRFVRDGVFIDPPIYPSATIVQLDGRYVLPPLADAHLHNLSGSDATHTVLSELRRDGIAYAVSLGDSAKDRPDSEACVARAGSAELLRSNGMITSPGGHPVMSYEALAIGKQMWSLTPADRERIAENPVYAGDIYWAWQSSDDVAAAETSYIAQAPDIVKIILQGEAGLNDETLNAVIAMAGRHQRRVFAHVDDLDDLTRAVVAQVDALAHTPGYDTGAALPGGIAAKIADANIAVNPTLGRQLAMEPFVPPQYRMTEDQRQALKSAHAAILQELMSADVTILAGFDLNGHTALDEIAYWVEIGATSETEAINIATQDTPRYLYPERIIGCLSVGCEASFIMTDTDPRTDMLAIRTSGSGMVIHGQSVPSEIPACTERG